MEAAPVIGDGLGASASSAPKGNEIVTIITITEKFRASPAISTTAILLVNRMY